MNFTHLHADGGRYIYRALMEGKCPQTGNWLQGVRYTGEDGHDRWTDLERWNLRFTPIVGEIVTTAEHFVLDDEDNVMAVIKFAVHEANDIRYMLISADSADKHSHVRFVIKKVLENMADAALAGLHVRDHDFPDMIGDVNAFHAKFGQEYLGKPRMLPQDLHDFRTLFHDEETHEYRDEYPKLVDAIERRDRRDIVNALEMQLDALVDAAFVILGTADLQFGRKTFIEAWRRVVKANMAKVRKEIAEDDAVDSGRAPKYDVVKPAGWTAPDHRDLVADNAIFDEVFGQEEA